MNSKIDPSTLRITDMRFADIDGAPKRCTLLKIYTNQGIVLFIVAILVSIVSSILSRIHLGFIGWILDVVVFIFALIGIINAAQGKAKELPYIGKYKILK